MELLKTSWPFDSDPNVTYDDLGYPILDRAVGADTLQRTFDKFFSDGVFSTSDFRISAASGLSVSIQPGMCIINGGMAGWWDEPKVVALSATAPQWLTHYAIFLRYDNNDDMRGIYLRIDASAAGASVPEPQSAANVTELRIGYVTVPANATDLSGATFHNEVGTRYAPVTTPLFDIDVTAVLEDLRERADEAYQAYYDLLISAVDGTTAYYLQSQIDEINENMITQDGLDLAKLRADMGLGDTLGVLAEEFGGTGSDSVRGMIRTNGLIAVSFASVPAIFAGTGIKSAYFPGATAIDTSAFENCTKLTSFDFADVTTIGSLAFSGCTALAGASGDNVASIGNSAFYGCTSLAYAEFSATTVGSRVFEGCTSLQSINLYGAETVGAYAFKDCSEVEYLMLPEATELTDAPYFTSGMSSLKYVRIGSGALTLPWYSSAVEGRATIVDLEGVAVDLHGVTGIVGPGTYQSFVLCYSQNSGAFDSAVIWIDKGATVTNAYLALTSRNSSLNTLHVYTDAAQADSSWIYSFETDTTVTYHFNQSYNSWLTEFGPK